MTEEERERDGDEMRKEQKREKKYSMWNKVERMAIAYSTQIQHTQNTKTHHTCG